MRSRTMLNRNVSIYEKIFITNLNFHNRWEKNVSRSQSLTSSPCRHCPHTEFCSVRGDSWQARWDVAWGGSGYCGRRVQLYLPDDNYPLQLHSTRRKHPLSGAYRYLRDSAHQTCQMLFSQNNLRTPLVHFLTFSFNLLFLKPTPKSICLLDSKV